MRHGRVRFHDQVKHPVFLLTEVNFRRVRCAQQCTNLYGDAVEPVAVHAQIKRVDANKPIRRRNHS